MLLVNWTNTMIITVVGFAIVFCVLTLLIFVIKVFGHVMAPRAKNIRKATSLPVLATTKASDRGEHIPALDSAAIATALHMYMDDAHDKESYMLKIRKVKRAYSPWNSKIYGLNYLNK